MCRSAVQWLMYEWMWKLVFNLHSTLNQIKMYQSLELMISQATGSHMRKHAADILRETDKLPF